VRFSCPEIWKGRARESGEKEERRSRRRKLQKLDDGEDPVVQQVEPQQVGGWRSGNQGHSGDRLLLTILPADGRAPLPPRASSHCCRLEARTCRVLSELLRPRGRVEFEDRPDLEGEGGGASAYIGESGGSAWLHRALYPAKTCQS